MIQKISHFALPVQYMTESVEFYRDVIRLPPFKNGKERTSFLISGQTLTLFLKSNASPSGDGPMIVLETNNLEQEHRRLEKAWVIFKQRPKKEPHGLVASFLDPNGHIISLIEENSQKWNISSNL